GSTGESSTAAIEGWKGGENGGIWILEPSTRVSEVRRRQMTTIYGDNIHRIAIEGDFDDCKEMVKARFADQSCRRGTWLGAWSSRNWARIMGQVV
ncbi:threonine synthase, partial [Pseudomonas ogarae]